MRRRRRFRRFKRVVFRLVLSPSDFFHLDAPKSRRVLLQSVAGFGAHTARNQTIFDSVPRVGVLSAEVPDKPIEPAPTPRRQSREQKQDKEFDRVFVEYHRVSDHIGRIRIAGRPRELRKNDVEQEASAAERRQASAEPKH